MRRAKYGNKRTEVDGITFDSKAEAKRWVELQLLAKAGELDDLARQVSYKLWVDGSLICTYRADFVYRDNRGLVVEDVKGVRTSEYRIKKKLMKALYGIDIVEIAA